MILLGVLPLVQIKLSSCFLEAPTIMNLRSPASAAVEQLVGWTRGFKGSLVGFFYPFLTGPAFRDTPDTFILRIYPNLKSIVWVRNAFGCSQFHPPLIQGHVAHFPHGCRVALRSARLIAQVVCVCDAVVNISGKMSHSEQVQSTYHMQVGGGTLPKMRDFQ